MPAKRDSGVPVGLGVRGAALWVSLGRVAGTAAGELALEACRLADRLDDLDSILRGKGVIDVIMGDLEDLVASSPQLTLKVVVRPVLTEVRQQQTTFRNLLAELGLEKSAAKPKPSSGGPAKSGLDQLAERREQKKA